MEALLEANRIGGHPVAESFYRDQRTADPAVYKLVRIEYDGSLIPATNDEVMEVEDFLSGPSLVEDSRFSSDEISPKKLLLDGLKDSAKVKVDSEKLNARLEYIREMLQKVKQEERLRLLCEYPEHSAKYNLGGCVALNRWQEASGREENPKAENSWHGSISHRRFEGNNTVQSRIIETLPVHANEPVIRESAVIDKCFNHISGISREVSLDNLSIRELQETFRATFGRTTSVKDKLWLKRRIAMGLTNSYDAAMSNFVTKEETLVRMMADEELGHSPSAIGGVIDHSRDLIARPFNQMQDLRADSNTRLRKTGRADEDVKVEDLQVGITVSKRVRKPTKRYIEELSEVETRESSWRSSSVKRCGVSPRISVGLAQGSETSFITRQDSFGGSPIQVPYVSRSRRGRPRENFMAMKCQRGGKAAKLFEKPLEMQISRPVHTIDSFHGTDFLESIGRLSDGKKGRQMTIQSGRQQQAADTVSPGDDNSDVKIATFPSVNGGTRRKHHRAWTLTEVLKLVEGVSRCGARWSEIKKLAFASYSYRTSVDLKDKWRNLLRASFSRRPVSQGVKSFRKLGSASIPTPILTRVRELAETHGQSSDYPTPTSRREVRTGVKLEIK